MANNPAPVPTSVALSPQQLAAATDTISPTIGSPTFSDPVGEFFRILELEFPVKSSEKILQLATFSRQKGETLKMLYRRLLKLKDNTQSITDLEAAHRYLCAFGGYTRSSLTGFATRFLGVRRLLHLAGCVHHI